MPFVYKYSRYKPKYYFNSKYRVVTAKVPIELYKLCKELDICISEVIRKALEEEVRKREANSQNH